MIDQMVRDVAKELYVHDAVTEVTGKHRCIRHLLSCMPAALLDTSLQQLQMLAMHHKNTLLLCHAMESAQSGPVLVTGFPTPALCPLHEAAHDQVASLAAPG